MPIQKRPPLLYSVNTYLAWAINERFYARSHFVWCSEVFDARALGSYTKYASTPPSSSPRDIYIGLASAVRAGDHNDLKIASNRDGIIGGATLKLKNGEISVDTFDEIIAIADLAQVPDFRPLIYVIPFTRRIQKRLVAVPVRKRAHPLSAEYIVEGLSANEFDILEIPYA